jgi:hypothetical protein
MPMTEEQYLAFEGNIQKVWDAVHKNNTDYLPQLFNMGKSTGARELHRSVGTFGRMADFNGTVNYDDFADGFEKEYRHGAKTTGVQADWRIMEDREYAKIASRTNGVAYGVHKTLQADGISVFNNATNAAILGPDGVPLGSTQHHLVPGDDHQSNLGTSDMDVESVDATITAMSEFKDDRGDIMEIVPDTIICGNYWRKTVKQIVGSTKEAFTSDNQINTHDDLKYIICPRITGKKWFMTNSQIQKGGDGLNFFMRQDPRKLERDSDFDALVLKWRAVGRWSYGWDNWFWCYVQNPA